MHRNRCSACGDHLRSETEPLHLRGSNWDNIDDWKSILCDGSCRPRKPEAHLSAKAWFVLRTSTVGFISALTCTPSSWVLYSRTTRAANGAWHSLFTVNRVPELRHTAYIQWCIRCKVHWISDSFRWRPGRAVKSRRHVTILLLPVVSTALRGNSSAKIFLLSLESRVPSGLVFSQRSRERFVAVYINHKRRNVNHKRVSMGTRILPFSVLRALSSHLLNLYERDSIWWCISWPKRRIHTMWPQLGWSDRHSECANLGAQNPKVSSRVHSKRASPWTHVVNVRIHVPHTRC